MNNNYMYGQGYLPYQTPYQPMYQRQLYPQQLTQMLVAQNPQLQLAMTRLMNMSKGLTPKEFIYQIATLKD